MADNPILLGQQAPAAATEVTLYTVPGATSATVSSIFVCNRSSVAATFRIQINDGGGATATTDALYFDLDLPGNDTFKVTGGITLETGDQGQHSLHTRIHRPILQARLFVI